LDVGCKDGAVGALLQAYGWRVIGLDQAEVHLKEASRRLSGAVAVDVTDVLPVRSAAADAVFAGEIIEHVIDTDAFLSELWRVLRMGGLLVLTTPNLASLENRVRLLLGKYPIWVDWRLGGEGHVRAYTAEILKRQMGEHGFRAEHVVGNWVPVLPQRWVDDLRYPWVARTGRWAPRLSMDIIVAARKIPERCEREDERGQV
jgi:2-polyprenyl-3-methyl-5-hydroxy-6-metoxy-1,4-benzoquinol methylase